MTTDLQEAFREAARREFAMVPNESELDYTFSPGFQRKMQRIIRAQVHGYWNMVNTLGKRIAIAAAIIVMLLTTAMAIKPIRERVIKFFVEVYEEFWEVRFGEENEGDIQGTSTPMKRYTFSQLPDGYYETKHVNLDMYLWTEWKNTDGVQLLLQQEIGTNDITIDSRFLKSNSIVFNDLLIYVSEGNEVDLFLWSQDGYVFLLSIYESFALEDQLTLIGSLIPYNQ